MSPSCNMGQPGGPAGWGLESWAWPWSTLPGSSTWGILNVPICLLPWAEPYTDQEPQALLMHGLWEHDCLLCPLCRGFGTEQP